MGDDYQSPITEDMDEFGKICVKSLSCNQSLIQADYDPAESIAGSDLEDEQLRKMLASPLYIQETSSRVVFILFSELLTRQNVAYSGTSSGIS